MKNLILAFMMLATLVLVPSVGFALDKGPDLDPEQDYYALIKTNHGDIPLVLFADKTPVTVKNFVNLAEGTAEFTDPKTKETVKRPFFNGLTFHRVIPDFMIQGGCPLGNGTGNPGYKFKDEFVRGLKFVKPGQLAMANSGPSTNGSQFFITEKATPWLNYKHTIFGEVLAETDAMKVVNEIARVPHNQTKPVEPVVMKEVKIFRYPKGTKVASVVANMVKGKAIPPAKRPQIEREPIAPKVENSAKKAEDGGAKMKENAKEEKEDAKKAEE